MARGATGTGEVVGHRRSAARCGPQALGRSGEHNLACAPAKCGCPGAQRPAPGAEIKGMHLIIDLTGPIASSATLGDCDVCCTEGQLYQLVRTTQALCGSCFGLVHASA